jgi:hypothetical protein
LAWKWKMVQSTNQARIVLSNSCDKNGKILVSLTCHQPVLPAFPRRMSSRHSLCLGRSAPRLESGSSGGTKPSAAKARRALGKSMRLVFAPGWRHQSKKKHWDLLSSFRRPPKKHQRLPTHSFSHSFHTLLGFELSVAQLKRLAPISKERRNWT